MKVTSEFVKVKSKTKLTCKDMHRFLQNGGFKKYAQDDPARNNGNLGVSG